MAPNSRIADVTSVVMMGRRIKSSGMFIATWQQSVVRSVSVACHSSLVLNLHLGSRKKHKLTVGHHFFSGLETLLDDRYAAKRGTGNNRHDSYTEVGLDHKDILARLTRLHGLVPDHDHLGPAGKGQHHVDELPGPQPPVGIGESPLEQDRPGRSIDGVVDEGKRALCGSLFILRDQRPNPQLPSRLILLDVGQVL